MAKRGAEGLSRREKVWGGVLLAGYLAVFPLAASRIFDSAEFLLGISNGRGRFI